MTGSARMERYARRCFSEMFRLFARDGQPWLDEPVGEVLDAMLAVFRDAEREGDMGRCFPVSVGRPKGTGALGVYQGPHMTRTPNLKRQKAVVRYEGQAGGRTKLEMARHRAETFRKAQAGEYGTFNEFLDALEGVVGREMAHAMWDRRNDLDDGKDGE